MCHAELANPPPPHEIIKEITDENTTAHCSVPMLTRPNDEAGPPMASAECTLHYCHWYCK